jgi:hypothetical protein
MNCERYQAELEDFLYGELAERQTVALRAHLAGCAACAQARDLLERENEIFVQYYEQTAFEPAPEVWEAIRSRIHAESPATRPLPEERAGWFSGLLVWFASSAWVRQAAFAAALVLVSVTATTLYLKSQQPNQNQLAGGAPTPSPTATLPASTTTPAATPAPVDLANQPLPVKPAPRPAVKTQPPVSEAQQIQTQIARAEREYQNAIKLLDRVIARHRDQFAPGMLKQYESSLALIDNSIAESRRALHERPDDAASGQFLLAAYAKKLELMQEIATQTGQ